MIQEIQLASPLLIMSVVSIIAVLIDAFSGKNRTFVFYFVLIGFIASLIASIYTLTIPEDVVKSLDPQHMLSKGTLAFGGYTSFFDALFSLAGTLVLLAAKPYNKREYKDYNEFNSLIAFATVGMMTIAHSSNLLTLFVGIELMSIPFYVLAGFFRNKIQSVESALKYFLLGAFATGFLLYGMAMIYGATESIDLSIISAKILVADYNATYLTIGLGLMMIGLSFKIAAFPFHQWAPDVYTGAPTTVTAFMSTAGKAAALAAFIIIAKSIMPIDDIISGIDNAGHTTAQIIIAVISAATMLIGNITALVQKNVKRMLAYSSVAHAGYLLMGIVANNPDGRSGILFYITAYMFMQIGAFIVVSVLERNYEQNLELSDYSGLRKSHPFIAAIMAIFMFSLAGLPPFAGFFGKYYLFKAAIEADFLWLTIVAVISSIISMYFYIGLVVYMYFRDSETHIEAKTGLAALPLAISTIGVILFGLLPFLLIDLAGYSLNFFIF